MVTEHFETIFRLDHKAQEASAQERRPNIQNEARLWVRLHEQRVQPAAHVNQHMNDIWACFARSVAQTAEPGSIAPDLKNTDSGCG
jgi:hypothetical protein